MWTLLMLALVSSLQEGVPSSTENGTLRQSKPVNKILCRKDQVFLECSCERTCCNGGRFEGCEASCKKGCFCKEGLVRHEDGRCIRLKDCEKENGENSPGPGVNKILCRKDEVFLECSCERTCCNGGRFEGCEASCKRGCFCKEGLVRHADGRCIRLKDCEKENGENCPGPEKCPKNEVHSDCVNPCNDCKTRGKCNFLVCNKGCDCRKGYYRDFSGLCIRAKQCPIIDQPTDQCGKNEEYYEDCAPSCGGTCETYKKLPLLNCIPCRPGCWCRKGLVKRKDGKCVPKDQCYAPTEKCPKNEMHSDCVNPCNDCQTRGKCNFLVCNKGCDCRKGYYRDFNGRCILARQCPQIDQKCPQNEVHSDCVNPCNDCQTRGKCNFLVCNKGCDCRKGYYRDFNGRCILARQCPQIDQKCPKNEVHSDCVNPCNDCQTRGKCNFLVCNKGCDCRKGYYRDFSGRCIRAKQCPIIDQPPDQCGKNEEYYEDCAPSCGGTCETYKKLPLLDCIPCRPGCWCRKGFVKRKDGECVPKDQCYAPTEKCPKNEVHSDCVNPCNDCQTRGKCNFLVCNRGCDCRKGYYRDFRGRCIRAKQCPIIDQKCKKNEVYSYCVNPCNDCQTRGKCEFLVCNKGCDCRKGYYRDFSGRCIRALQCPIVDQPPDKCGKNEEYYEDCAPSCGGTCETYKKLPLLDCIPCRPGCWCRKGFVKRKDGECVPKDQCYTPTASPPSSNAVCQQPKKVGPCKALMPRYFYNQETRQCEQFNYGGCRGNENNFKTKEECEYKCGSE